MPESHETAYAGLTVRLLAGIYDVLVMAALWFGVGLMAVVLNGGEALTGAARIPLLIGLWIVSVGYLALSWQRAGQTLGMRAWRLHMVAASGNALGWRRALHRAVWALLQILPFGLGLLPIVFDREHRSLADCICRTRVVRLPKPARRARTCSEVP